MMQDEEHLQELCLTWQRQMAEAAMWAGPQERVQYSACPETGARARAKSPFSVH